MVVNTKHVDFDALLREHELPIIPASNEYAAPIFSWKHQIRVVKCFWQKPCRLPLGTGALQQDTA